MAEFMVKVGSSGPGERSVPWRDGDIIHAFNDRKILWTNANRICHWRLAGRNGHGLVPSGLADMYLEKTSRYRFERVSTKEVLRTEIRSGRQELFSDVPRLVDGLAQHIHVEEFLKLRSKRAYPIFGVTGREVWYGGATISDQATIDDVWTRIEANSYHRRNDNLLWPAGSADLTDHFLFVVDDFDDETASRLKAPQTDGNGEIKFMRLHYVQIDALPGMTAATLRKIRDKRQRVDREPGLVRKRTEIVRQWPL